MGAEAVGRGELGEGDERDVVIPPFADRVYRLVRQIPHGRVVSYGGVAAMLGLPRAARAVGRALRDSTERDEAVPWWRVINRNGEISIRGTFPGAASLQRELLEREGVEFDLKGRVDWKRFGWVGPDEMGPGAVGSDRLGRDGMDPDRGAG